jgi:hypothetical protein
LLEGCGGREGRTGRGCEEWRAVVGWSVERGRGGEGDTDTGAERSSACAAKGVGEHFGDLGAWMSREADLEAKDREVCLGSYISPAHVRDFSNKWTGYVRGKMRKRRRPSCFLTHPMPLAMQCSLQMMIPLRRRKCFGCGARICLGITKAYTQPQAHPLWLPLCQHALPLPYLSLRLLLLYRTRLRTRSSVSWRPPQLSFVPVVRQRGNIMRTAILRDAVTRSRLDSA